MQNQDLNGYSSKGQAYDASEDIGRNPSTEPTIGDVINRRFGRRDLMRGALAVSAVAAIMGPVSLASRRAAAQAASRYVFDEIEHGVDETHHVAPGYDADILIRWGDPMIKGAPAFDPMNQTAAAQETQFGYNCDFLGLVPLDDTGDRFALCVNHEYTDEELMFPNVSGPQDAEDAMFKEITPEMIDIELAAHGGSVVEVVRADGKWSFVPDSPINRRITMLSTEMELTGPAAGDPRLQTTADPTGTKVIGMLNNCAGGITPWGTWLSGEENVHGYFWGDLADDNPEVTNHKRYGVPGKWYNWGTTHARFDIAKDPHEANRFGWIVEIDPLDPASTPKKRTALGRFKHEGANTIVNGDGRVAAYMGDDERFEYIYKFVSTAAYDASNPASGRDILDDGTLYVARFNADGTVSWLPLVHGQGALTAENGFASQADVVIEARRAGDVLGATPMDRPEDVEANPVTGKIYAMLTNNTRRKAADDAEAGPAQKVDAVNTRPDNAFGYVLEVTPTDGDHALETASWEILVQCGDPAIADVGAMWNPATSANGWFGMPDNCAFDGAGRLWVTTDGNSFKGTGTTDGMWGVETEGEQRGTGKMFFRVPVGAEMCGPWFTADDTALFLAVQHPATDNVKDWPPFGRSSTFADPATRWPDFQDGMPPRPSVVVVTKQGGGKIAS